MTCHEIEALRLGLMNVLGDADEEARRHAEQELGHKLEEAGPIAALAEAETIDELGRHLDTVLVDLEEEIATTEAGTQQHDYLRGRLVAVRDAEAALDRFATQGTQLLAGMDKTHHLLHELFPTEE